MVASYSSGKKSSFGQTVRKWSLRLAFAAAIGGAGYNYYGTQEDIVAKITSIDVIPSDNKDKAPQVFIHTDKGTFVNKTTWMYLKDENDVQALVTVLQPGTTVKLSVYGTTAKIGNVGFDDFMMYRNIINAVSSDEKTTAPLTAVVNTPVLPVVVTTPVVTDSITPAPIDTNNTAVIEWLKAIGFIEDSTQKKVEVTPIAADSITPAPIDTNNAAVINKCLKVMDSKVPTQKKVAQKNKAPSAG
jgi:hypothetical protein